VVLAFEALGPWPPSPKLKRSSAKRPFRYRPNLDAQAGNLSYLKRSLIQPDHSRFSISNRHFRERAIGNRVWESRFAACRSARSAGPPSRYRFPIGNDRDRIQAACPNPVDRSNLVATDRSSRLRGCLGMIFNKERNALSPASFFINCLLLVVVVALADITITEWALHHQGATESNPVVAHLHESGFWSLMVFRFAIIAGLLIALITTRLHTGEYISIFKTPTLDLFFGKGGWKNLDRKTRWKTVVWISVLGLTFSRLIIVFSNVMSSITGYSVITGVQAALQGIGERQLYFIAILISVALGFTILAVTHKMISKRLGGEAQVARG
jgi:hypothetical protein